VPPQSQISAYLALIESHYQDAERIGEMLVACGSVTANELAEALAVQKNQEPHARIGEILVEQGAVPPQVVKAAVDQGCDSK